MLSFLTRTFLFLLAAIGLGVFSRSGPKRPVAGARPARSLPGKAERIAPARAEAAPRGPNDGVAPRLAPAEDGNKPAFASYGGSGFVAGVVVGDAARTGPASAGDPALLAAPDHHGRTASPEARAALPDDPLADRHRADELDFRTVDYGNAKAAARTASESRSRDDGWTVPEAEELAGRAVFEESPAAFKSGGGSGTVHGAPENGDPTNGDPGSDPAEAEVQGSASKASKAKPEAVAPQRLEGARNGKPDDLTRIHGIGPSIERLLFDHGIFHFEQIARWGQAEARWADALTGFGGRVAREKWIVQAKDFRDTVTKG